MLRVAVSDFPVYDGSGPPDEFIVQCRRLATLGGIPGEQLSAIVTVRCRGLALQVLEGDGGQTDVLTLLQKTFGSKQPEAASAQLSTAQKGTMPVLDYSVFIRKLVHDACPEFFDESGNVKKICVPAYQAALYRHFLVGLSAEEKILLSRQGAKTFDAAVDELKREELVSSSTADELHRSHRVHWAESAAVRAAGGGRFASTPASSRRDLSPAARAACRGRRGSRSPERDRSRRGGSAERFQGQATATWRDRRQTSSSDRSPDGSTFGAAPPDGRRWARDRAPDGQWRRPRSPANMRRADRSPGPRSAACDPRDRPSADRGGRPDDPAGERRREVQCWSCRGFGHLKRHCPNGQLGRLAGEW